MLKRVTRWIECVIPIQAIRSIDMAKGNLSWSGLQSCSRRGRSGRYAGLKALRHDS